MIAMSLAEMFGMEVGMRMSPWYSGGWDDGYAWKSGEVAGNQPVEVL